MTVLTRAHIRQRWGGVAHSKGDAFTRVQRSAVASILWLYDCRVAGHHSRLRLRTVTSTHVCIMTCMRPLAMCPAQERAGNDPQQARARLEATEGSKRPYPWPSPPADLRTVSVSVRSGPSPQSSEDRKRGPASREVLDLPSARWGISKRCPAGSSDWRRPSRSAAASSSGTPRHDSVR